MKLYFYRLALIIILSSIFLSWSSLFASKVFAADVGVEIINTPLVPTLPSPGDNVSVDVAAYNFLNVRQTAIVEVNVAPGQYITDPDTQTYNVSLPAYGSDTRTLTFGVTSNVCQTGSVPFVATATIYVGARNWGTDTSSTTLSDGIGATLNVNVNVSASINLRRSDGVNIGTQNGTSANFRRLNCNYSYTLTTSAAGYTTSVRTINSGAGPDPKVCNGQETTTTVTLVVAPPPSPSPSPSPAPSSSPSSSPTPTPTPSPVGKFANLSYACSPVRLLADWNVGAGNNCNAYIQAGEVPHPISNDCNSNGQRTVTGDWIWDDGRYQLHIGDPSGDTTSSSLVTIDCNVPPPPPPPNPITAPPYKQIIAEVANVTKGENPLGACEGGDQAGWYWPPDRGPLRTSTTAEPGDEILIQLCARNKGDEDMRYVDWSLWLNQAFPGTQPLEGKVSPSRWPPPYNLWWQPDWWMQNEDQRGTVTYHPFHGNNALQIPFHRVKGSSSDCGDPNKWRYSCTIRVRMKFTINSNVSGTLSSKASLNESSFVNPYDFHPYLTRCQNATQTGFWERNPGCCWGNPDQGGYPGCPKQSQPDKDNCRYGTCDSNGISEDFWFWSNWIRINVGPPISPWIQVTGDVHSNVRIYAPGGP